MPKGKWKPGTEIRKGVLEYDDVLNRQRETIYGLRHQLLLGENVYNQVLEMLESVIGRLVLSHTDARTPEEWDFQGILDQAEQIILPPQTFTREELEEKASGDLDTLKKILYDTALAIYKEKEEKAGTDNLRGFERFVMLRTIDNLWMEHLQNMDDLREGIGLRAYAQQDPLIVYKIESYQMFQGMMEAIQEEVVRFLFMMQISEEAPDRGAATEHRH